MSSQKRKLHSDDAEASPSNKKTKHVSPSKKKTKHASPSNKKTKHASPSKKKVKHASPSKKKTQDAKIFPKAHKRQRSLFETRIIISSGESDSDFQDDSGNDPDWITETQSKCLSSEGEDCRNEATDEHNASTKDAEKVTQGLKKKKKRKRMKKRKEEVTNAVCKKRKERKSHAKGLIGGVEQETCDICMRVLKTYHMKKHKKLHAENERYETPNGVYKCLNCLKCFDDRRRLGTHRRCYCPLNATGEKKDGAEDDDTSKDPRQSKSESMFKCDSCHSQFEIFSDLQEHSKTHRKTTSKRSLAPSVRCPKCSLVCCSFAQLKIHNTVVHINKGLDVYKCKICYEGFGSKSLLRNHMQRYHKPRKAGVTYKCHYCHLLYDTWQLRQRHINQVHGEKGVCEYCGKTFHQNRVRYHQKQCQMNPQNQQKSKKQSTAKSRASSKKASKKVGSVTSPKSKQTESVTSRVSSRTPKSECYECKKCCISFESRNNYVMHKKTCKMKNETDNNHDAGHESQPERKVFVCEACQDIFSENVKLCAHEAEHLSLICKDCDEIIPDKETLEMHVLLECPERYKLFSNKTHREEIDANRDAAEIVETTQENETSSNPVDSSPTTCTDVNIENVNKQMNYIPEDGKPNISGTAEEKAISNKKNAISDIKKNKTHGSEAVGHTCPICLATFGNEEHLSIHKMVHVVHVIVTEDEEMGTDIQDIKTNLNDDSKQVEKTQKICSSCNVEFTSAAALKEHQKRVSLTESKYPHQCPICPGSCVSTSRPMMLNACDHLQHKKQFKFLCQFCGKHFENNHGLVTHINQSHDCENKKECPGCHQIFGPVEYQQHIEYNRKEVEHLNLKCLSCGEVFASPSALDDHTERFNHKCNICWQHFQDKDRLKKHRKQSHNVSTKFKSTKGHWCKHCSKFFDKASLISAHVKSVLEKESSESLSCSWEYKYSTCLRCGVSYTKDSDYRLHKFIWEHSCHTCHQHFKREILLKTHYQKLHVGTGLRSMPQIFRCKYCGHSFDTLRDKIKHEFKTKYEKRGSGLSGYIDVKFPSPCEDCNEMLDTVCQLDVHRRRHKQKPVVSCRFCREEFTRLMGFYRHSKKIHKKCTACGIKLYSACQQRIHREKRCRCLCMYCGGEFKQMAHKNAHEKGVLFSSSFRQQARCSVCSLDLACCQITDHRKHVEDKIKGELCSYCLKAIPSTDYKKVHKIVQHQKIRDKLYLCRCGETIQAVCQKNLHGKKFVCCKCGAHFAQYQDLVTHLVKYNIHNVNTNVSAEDSSELIRSRKSLIEIETWNTVEEEEKTIYVCLYCGDKVDTYEEMMDHKSTFKYECPQCKKHFRTPLAANHHFKQVNHETCRSQPEITKKTGGPMSVTKRETSKAKDDILTQYCQQSACDELYQQDKESEQHSERSTMEFQIGFEEYSIVTANTTNVNEDIALNASEAQNEWQLSNNNEIPKRASESSPDATKSLEDKSVEPHPREEDESNIKVPNQAMANQQTCVHCKEQFTSRYLYVRHLASEDQETKGVLYTCTKCDRSFDVMCGLEYHIARMCKHCGMHFSNVEVKVDHEQQCKNKKMITDCNSFSALSNEMQHRLVASVKESRSQVMEDEELMPTAVETDDRSDAETESASEGMEVVSRNEVEEKRSSVYSKQGDGNEDAMATGKVTDDINTNLEIKSTVEDGIEEVCSEVEAKLSSVHSKQGDVNAAIDDTPSKKDNDNVNTDFEIENAVEGNDAITGSEAGKEVPSLQNDNVGRSNRVRKSRQKHSSLIMNLTKPVTRKGNLQKRAMTDEKKCEFCLQTSSKLPKKLNKNRLCYQNEESLKWMRCVCLPCNLELPSKCHINFHLDMFARCPIKKHGCGKHFTTRTGSSLHSCHRCGLCAEIDFCSKNDLEKHKNNWHKIVYEEIPRGSSEQLGSIDQIQPINASMIVEHEETEAAESIQPVGKKQMLHTQAPTKRNSTTKAIGEKTHKAPKQVALTVTSEGLKPTQASNAAMSELKVKTTTLPLAFTRYVGREFTTPTPVANCNSSGVLVRKQVPEQSTERDDYELSTGCTLLKTKEQQAMPLSATKAMKNIIEHITARGNNELNSTSLMQSYSQYEKVTPKKQGSPSDSQQDHHQRIKETSHELCTQSELNSQNTAVVLQESIQQVNSSPIEIQKPKKMNQMPVTHGGVNATLQASLSSKIQGVSLSMPERLNAVGSGRVNLAVSLLTPTVLPGGLVELDNIVLASQTWSIKRISGEKEENHFVECVTVDNQSYLTFNHPTSHQGAFNMFEGIDDKFSVVIVKKDQDSKPSCELVSLRRGLRRALVVEIGQCKVHTIDKMYFPNKNYAYVVELTKTLPITTKQVNSTPVASKAVTPTLPITTNGVNSRPLVATTQVNSTASDAIRAANSSLLDKTATLQSSTQNEEVVVSRNQVTSTFGAAVDSKRKEKASTFVPLAKPKNPTTGKANVAVLPGGLVELFNIALAAETSIGRTLLIGEEAENHFVKWVAVNNKTYLTFNYPASHKAIFKMLGQNEEKFSVTIMHIDQTSKPSDEMESPRQAIVTEIGAQHEVHSIEKLNDLPGSNYAYVVELKKQIDSRPLMNSTVSIATIGANSRPLVTATKGLNSRPLVTSKQVNSTAFVAARGLNSRPPTTKQVNSTVSVAAKGARPVVTTKQVNSTVSVAATGANSRSLVNAKQVTSAVTTKQMNLSTARTNVAILPGGLVDLANIEVGVTEISSIGRTLLIGEEAENQFVECVTINNQSYLTFNYPSSHMGILNAGLQNDGKFSVMIMHKDQKSKPSSGMECPKKSLVIEIGRCKVHTIEKLNHLLAGNYTYMVELTKTLPINSKDVNSTCVTSKEVNSISPITTREGNSRPLVTSKQMSSALPVSLEKVIPITAVTRNEFCAPLDSKRKQRGSTSVPLSKAKNPSIGRANVAILPGGLVELANIELGAEKSSIRKSFLFGEKEGNHFVEFITIYNQSYLTFNYPASDMGTFNMFDDEKFSVIIRHTDQTSGEIGSPQQALVVEIGQSRVHTIKCNYLRGNYWAYMVELTKTLPITTKQVNSTPVTSEEVKPTLPITTNQVESRPLVTTHQGNSTVYVAAKEANLRPLVTAKQGNSTVSVATEGANSRPLVTPKQVNSTVSVATEGANSRPLVTTKQVNSTVYVAAKEANSRPLVTTKQGNSTVSVATEGANSRPLVTPKQVNSTVSVATKEANSRPLVTTKQGNSTVSVAAKEANSRPLVTTKQGNSTVSVAAKEADSRPLVTMREGNSTSPVPTQEVNSCVLVDTNGNEKASTSMALDTENVGNPSITNTFFSVVPGGLIGFTDILFDTKHAALVTNTLLLGEKALEHFVECVTINDESYVKFNHPANYTGIITSCEELLSGKKRLTVTIAPNSSNGASHRDALVVKIGQYKVHSSKMYVQNIVYTYSVDLFLYSGTQNCQGLGSLYNV
ncbi:uncharacterized protein [Amphiura filiformis]|uniref:uncharacterized protein n=1 Tax=Amphiura filiformis TaxID=82378 RepID=UPI003B20BC3B